MTTISGKVFTLFMLTVYHFEMCYLLSSCLQTSELKQELLTYAARSNETKKSHLPRMLLQVSNNNNNNKSNNNNNNNNNHSEVLLGAIIHRPDATVYNLVTHYSFYFEDIPISYSEI